MITTIIRTSIKYSFAVWVVIASLVALSLYALKIAPMDAIPDISDPQIVVYTKWARSPELIDTQINTPLIKSLMGVSDIKAIRSTSHMGYSFTYVILKNEGQRAKIREIVTDRINAIRLQLPADATIALGPNASSMGWIYQYALIDRQNTHDLRDLRLLHENRIKPALQSIAGVAEVASVGGLEKQYQLKLFPQLLAENGITLRQLLTTFQGISQETGGRGIEVANRDYQIRGVVNYDNIDKLEAMVVGRNKNGTAIHLKDIGYIQVGYDQRRGIADLNGKGEVVGGIVIMEQKQNVLEVNQILSERLKELKTSLPEGVDIITTYDRSTLIWDSLKHFFGTLLYELVVVIVVTVLFLRNLRTAIAPVLILLLGVLFTALPMSSFHQTINLFSLAGLIIAIGEMIDATIVIVENCAAELAAHGRVLPEKKQEIIVQSIANVGRPLFFSLLIILASFLPVFFLGEKESRLFDPLAYSKTFAMAFSTLLTIFLLPIVITWVFKKDSKRSLIKPHDSLLARAYRGTIKKVIQLRYLFLIGSIISVVAAVVLLSNFKKEFMPQMEEGSILYMPTTLPGLPMREAGWILQHMDAKLKSFPEVDRVFGKLGRADTSTDPAPVSMIETTILLKPKQYWREGMTKEKLVAEMDKGMKMTGYINTWVQPISARVLMQDTGIQTAVGIKVKGDDIATIENIGQRIEALLTTFANTKSVIAERISSGSFIDIQLDPARLSEFGVNADDAMLTVRYAIGGDNIVGIHADKNMAIPLNMQYASEYIDTLQKIRKTPVVNAVHSQLTLDSIAKVSVSKTPEMIRNENGELTGYIYVDIKNVSATEYVAQAKTFLAKNLGIPSGYTIEWTGEYKNTEAAHAKLSFIVPITLIIMFGLLIIAFRSIRDSLIIMLSAPFALVGAIFLQWYLGYPMTTAVIIGYIALFAVAIQTAIIMVVFIRQSLDNRTEKQTYVDAILDGSVARLRPKLMTVACTIFSLLPVMFSNGSGMEIMKPIAAPTVGGMISSTLYVLFLIPCLFVIGDDIKRRRQK